jgi:4-amino-4-deoxy-L-arabinose transferase-like glycosyltransferase
MIPRYQWMLLCILVAMVSTVAAGTYGLLDNNEGLYAEIAREMIESGDWAMPRLNYDPYIEKPPLLYWSIAVSMIVFGQSEWAVRLAPAVFFAGTIAGVVWFGLKSGRRRGAYLAGIILASSTGFAVFNRTLLFDVPLTCFLTWSYACFGLWLLEGRERKSFYISGFWIFLGPAVLSKGVMALALAGIVGLVSILTLRVPIREAVRIFSPMGIAAFLLITLPWHALMMVREPDFGWWYFINETVMRFFDQRYPRDYYHGPMYYYLERIPVYLWVWTAFLPLLLIHRRKPDPSRTYLWSWFLTLLIFFSISLAKANYYMITGIPALALLLAFTLDDFLDKASKRPFVVSASIMAGMNITVIIASCILIMNNQQAWTMIRGHALLLIGAGAFLLAGISYAIILALKEEYMAVIAMATVMGIAPLLFAVDILPDLENRISQRHAAQWILSHPGASVVLYADYEDISSLQFYLARKLPIVDSRSDDLFFAKSRTGDPSVFITRSDLCDMARQRPVFLISCNRRMDECLADSSDHFRIRAVFPRVTILSNKSRSLAAEAHEKVGAVAPEEFQKRNFFSEIIYLALPVSNAVNLFAGPCGNDKFL